MYLLDFKGARLFNEETLEFTYVSPRIVKLEHSLISLSKWEGRHHKAFLKENAKHTMEEQLDYIYCMCIDKDVDPMIFASLSETEIKKIQDYISDPMTAVKFRDEKSGGSKAGRDVVTADLIYYWMVSLQIPFECEKWHLNRLLALIRVCNIKNAPEKKMSKNEIYARNRALNKSRRAKSGSRG